MHFGVISNNAAKSPVFACQKDLLAKKHTYTRCGVPVNLDSRTFSLCGRSVSKKNSNCDSTFDWETFRESIPRTLPIGSVSKNRKK